MKRYAVLALALTAIWLLNSGHYTPLLLALMLCSVAFVVLLARRMETVDSESVPLRMALRIAPYYVWLFKQLVLSNIDVVRRIWIGSEAVEPVMEKMPISQTTDVGRVILANSITLTPGTVSVSLESDHVVVHALSREGWESLRDSDIDQRVTRLER